MAAAAGPLYRLADYLDQHGRAHRASQIPPAEFWSAAAAHAAPGDQAALGDAAHARGLYRDAAQLHKNAAASGNLRAVLYLSDPPACLRADPRPAHWAAAHAALDDPARVASLLDSLREAGADEQAAALLARDPAAHAALDDPDGVACLLDSLREAGADEQAAALASPGRRPRPPRRPGRRGQPAGQPAGGGRATSRPPRCWPATPPPTPPSTTRTAWPACWTACGRRARTSRPPRCWPATRRPRRPRRPGRRGRLLDSLREAGAHEQAAALLARDPAAHAALDDPGAVARLLDSLREAGAHEQAAALAAGPPPTPPSTTRTPWPACWTACGRRARTSRPPRWPARGRRPRRPRRPGRRGQPAGQPAGGGRGRAGRRAAGPRPRRPRRPRRPGGVASLLDSLREAGADEQAAALAARAAAHAALDDPVDVASLLDSLREAGAHEQAAALAGRAAAHAPLDDPGAVAGLLDSLREAGAHEQAAALAARLPAAGMFGLFLEQQGLRGSVPFRTGGRRHPGRAMGLGRPGLMACSSSAGTGGTGAGLSGMPTWAGMRHGSPAHGRQHRNRRDELNNTHPNRPNQFFEARPSRAPVR